MKSCLPPVHPVDGVVGRDKCYRFEDIPSNDYVLVFNYLYFQGSTQSGLFG